MIKNIITKKPDSADAAIANDIENVEGFDIAATIATENEHKLGFREAIRLYPTAAFWAIVVSFTIIMEGYDTSLMSSLYAYPQFKEKYGQYHADIDQYVLDARWQAVLGDAMTFGSLIGLIINSYVTEKFGHRFVIMISLMVMSAFIFLTFFAPNVEVLLTGQILIGIPSGIFTIMGSAYASEICPLALRGFLTSFVNICWVIGQLIAAGVLQGLVNNTTEWAYRIPFGVQWVWIIPLFIIALFAPDSPWWLIRKGRLADAEKSLVRLSSNSTQEEIRLKMAMMMRTNNLEKAMNTESSVWDCFRSTNLRRTEAAAMVLVAQPLSGQPFGYGSTFFFGQAGISPPDSYKLNLGGYALSFVATIGSWVLMNWYGRRPIIIWGLAVMTATLLVIGVLDYPAASNNNATWAQAVLALVWLGVYSLTLGPQSFALVAEVSATRVRSQTISIAKNFYNVFQIFGNTVEPYLINPTKANLRGRTAFVWMGFSAVVLLWCIFRLPETRNLTYEELDILFDKRVPAWRFNRSEVNLIRETEKDKGSDEEKRSTHEEVVHVS